jgi:hypothetical protein
MKKTATLILLFFVSAFGFSQSFMQGAGVAIFVANVNNSDPAVVAGLTYSPRFNFVEMENMSVSVGVPLTVGVSGYYNSMDDENSSLSFMVNVPLMINLNVGAGSTKENERRFGFFVGAGFGYHLGSFTTNTTDGYGDEFSSYSAKSSYGPAANAGVRIAVGSHHKNIEIRLSYLKGIDVNSVNAYGVATLFNF